MVWQSEVVIYGLIFLNGLVVAAGMLWAYRRGHFQDLEDAGQMIFQDDPARETTHER